MLLIGYSILGPLGASYIQYLDERQGRGAGLFRSETNLQSSDADDQTAIRVLYFALKRNSLYHRQWMIRSYRRYA